MMVHFPQFSDNVSRESTGEDIMLGKTHVGLELGNVGKAFGNRWDILINLWKSSSTCMVKSSSESSTLPEQKSHVSVLENV